VTTMHALFTTEVECKTASAQSILVIVRFSNDRLLKSWPELQTRLTQLARESLRRQAWPTSGEVVTGFQSDSSRTDSPVRVLHAQPGSRSPRALLKVASAEGPPLFDSRVFQRRES
jgi:hypothetical protein